MRTRNTQVAVARYASGRVRRSLCAHTPDHERPGLVGVSSSRPAARALGPLRDGSRGSVHVSRLTRDKTRRRRPLARVISRVRPHTGDARLAPRSSVAGIGRRNPTTRKRVVARTNTSRHSLGAPGSGRTWIRRGRPTRGLRVAHYSTGVPMSRRLRVAHYRTGVRMSCGLRVARCRADVRASRSPLRAIAVLKSNALRLAATDKENQGKSNQQSFHGFYHLSKLY